MKEKVVKGLACQHNLMVSNVIDAIKAILAIHML